MFDRELVGRHEDADQKKFVDRCMHQKEPGRGQNSIRVRSFDQRTPTLTYLGIYHNGSTQLVLLDIKPTVPRY